MSGFEPEEEQRRFLVSDGDVIHVHESSSSGNPRHIIGFKREEEVLDKKITRVPVPDPINPRIDQETGEYIPRSEPVEVDENKRIYSRYSAADIALNEKKARKATLIAASALGITALSAFGLFHFRDQVRNLFKANEKPVVVEQVTRELPKRVEYDVRGSFDRLRKTFETNDVNNFEWIVPQGIGKLEERVVEETVITARPEIVKKDLGDYGVKRIPKKGQGLGDIVWEEVLKVAYPTAGRNEILYGKDGNSGLVNLVATQNGISDPNLIVPGKELIVEVKSGLRELGYGSLLERQDPPEQFSYVVKEGDTLTKIAEDYKARFNVRNSIPDLVQRLCDYNGISNCNLIKPNQEIKFSIDALSEVGVSALPSNDNIGREYALGLKAKDIAKKNGINVNDVHVIGNEYVSENGIMFTRFDHNRYGVNKLSDISREAKELYTSTGNKTEVQRQLKRKYGGMSWHTADKLINGNYEVLRSNVAIDA